jgi:predicted transcriptional regulator
MKRTTIFIEEGTERELQALARQQRRPMASIVREAVEKYIVEQRGDKRPHRLGFIAAGRSGHADTAERHEALLFDEAAPLPPRSAGTTPAGPARKRAAGRTRRPRSR